MNNLNDHFRTLFVDINYTRGCVSKFPEIGCVTSVFMWKRFSSIFLRLTMFMFQEDASNAGARHFYIAQWYRDANAEITKQNGIE